MENLWYSICVYYCLQDFFERRGVTVMTVSKLFNFVVDQNIADEDVDDYLEKVCLYVSFQ